MSHLGYRSGLLFFHVTTLLFAANSQTPMVRILKVSSIELYDEMFYPVKIHSQIESQVLSEMDGVVISLNAPMGSKISAGQTVLTLKNSDPLYQFHPNKITSPLTGIVSELFVQKANYVARGTKLFTVTDPNKLVGKFEAATDDAELLKLGKTGTMILDGKKENVITVKITGMGSATGSAIGTIPIEIKPEKSITKEKIGTIQQVQFKTNVRSGIQIPENALVYKGDKILARTLTPEKTAKLTEVKTGTYQSGQVEILEGLTTGELLIVTSTHFLSDGQKVETEEKSKN